MFHIAKVSNAVFFSSINAWMPDFYFKPFMGFSVAAGLYLSGTLCPELHIDLHGLVNQCQMSHVKLVNKIKY